MNKISIIVKLISFAPSKIYLKLRYCRRIIFGGLEMISNKTSIRLTGENGRILVGRGVRIEAWTTISSANGKIEIGKNVFINRGCMIVSMSRINIEEDVTIGPGVYIYDHDHDMNNRGCFISKPVHIGKKAWIGAGVIILKGVNIGNNAVIGAGSVVTKDVPDNTIVCGNPARVVN